MSFWIPFLNAVSTAIAWSASPAQPITRISSEDLAPYRCATDISTMVGAERQAGPVFSEGGLVFTSIDARDGRRLLIVNAGSGTYSFPLGRLGVNRLRFLLPAAGVSNAKLFFLSYAHDSSLRSRYFEFSVGVPPGGREEVDYELQVPQKSEHLLPHLEYAIFQTSEILVNAVTEGKTNREQWARRKTANCDFILKKPTVLARQIRRNMDVLEMIMVGPASISTGSRQPASVVVTSMGK